MKKTAILIYNQFCNFEISVILEILSIAEKPITIFAKDMNPVTSEERIKVIPDRSIKELKIEEYDSLILPGAMDIRETIEDESIINFIKEFNSKGVTIGAISIAPILLLRAGVLCEKPFMAGFNKKELYEEGFTDLVIIFFAGWNTVWFITTGSLGLRKIMYVDSNGLIESLRDIPRLYYFMALVIEDACFIIFALIGYSKGISK